MTPSGITEASYHQKANMDAKHFFFPGHLFISESVRVANQCVTLIVMCQECFSFYYRHRKLDTCPILCVDTLLDLQVPFW